MFAVPEEIIETGFGQFNSGVLLPPDADSDTQEVKAQPTTASSPENRSPPPLSERSAESRLLIHKRNQAYVQMKQALRKNSKTEK